MPKYNVTFYQSSTYVVEAENESDAIRVASPKFDYDMRRPIARTDYDDVEVELEEGDEDDE